MRDREILDLLFARDERALSETAEKYGSYLGAIAQRILNNEADTEEVLNDAYHSAWRTIPPKRPDILKLYLARIVRNLAIDRLEYRLAQKRNSDQTILLSEIAEILKDGTDIEKNWEACELRAQINQFLLQLDVQSRVIFVCRYWKMCSINEIAQQRACSESYVKNSLFRTRKKLRKFLEKAGIAV